MAGTYDFGLVALSYLIASLAGFVALEFATRLRVRSRNSDRWPWLLGGALAMGTGIWSMHFVGMTAFSLPVPISYDVGITVLSWLAAVVVSAIALYIVGYGRLNAWTLAFGAVVMGAGVCLMHYSGMWAMRMTPGITYNTGLFAASVAIAVAASGAALAIIAYLKEVRTWGDFALRVGAALIMGFAVVGMHYTGMAAAEFADGAFCFSGNALSAAAMPWPTAVATLAILGCGIAFAVSDARGLAAARRNKRAADARVLQMAFVDRETGLPNRARLSQLIVERVRRRPGDGFSLVTFRLEGRSADAAVDGELVSLLRDRLQAALPQAFLARTTPDHIVAVLDGPADENTALCARIVASLQRDAALAANHFVVTGSARYPADGQSAQWLILRATPKAAGDGPYAAAAS